MRNLHDTNTAKLLTIAAALLISCGSVLAVGAWSNAAVHAAQRATTDRIVTLPTITVRPTAEQLRTLHRGGQDTAATSGGGGGGAFDMPYYSFAARPALH